MRTPYSWLKDFAPFDLSPDEFGVRSRRPRHGGRARRARRTRARRRRSWSRSSRPCGIPNADRMQIVDVDTGDGEALQIVCGAFNFAAGDLVPLGDHRDAFCRTAWRSGEPRSVESGRTGCSASPDELGLGDDHGGILVLDSSLALGMPINDALGIEVDVVYDLDITSNRPDAMCMAGVARDAAAKLGLPFASARATHRRGSDANERTHVGRRREPRALPRFTARVDLRASRSVRPLLCCSAASPWPVCDRSTTWSTCRTTSCSNSANPRTPTTATGCPVRDSTMRAARPGEIVRTLDGVDRAAGEAGVAVGLIGDADGDPVGIAGIMGGESSEIAESTDRRRARGGVLHADDDRLGVEASQPPDRGVGPIRAGRRPRRNRVGIRPLLRARRLGHDQRWAASTSGRRLRAAACRSAFVRSG